MEKFTNNEKDAHKRASFTETGHGLQDFFHKKETFVT